MTTTDKIEKTITFRASRSRVWTTLTDPKHFGAWLNFEIKDTFAPGKKMRGKITLEKFAELSWEFEIVRMDPETLFSFRWRPYAIDPSVDYSDEEPTLVEFHLEGTKLTVTESGFDRVPVARRAKAFEMNDMGWGMVLKSMLKTIDDAR